MIVYCFAGLRQGLFLLRLRLSNEWAEVNLPGIDMAGYSSLF